MIKDLIRITMVVRNLSLKIKISNIDISIISLHFGVFSTIYSLPLTEERITTKQNIMSGCPILPGYGEGLGDGMRVGCPVGRAVVGAAEGLPVGLGVGAAVGVAVGAAVKVGAGVSPVKSNELLAS